MYGNTDQVTLHMQTVTTSTLSVSAKDISSHDLIQNQVHTACTQPFQGF